MADNTFHTSVVTPERAVLETEATFVALPAHDGEIGILRNRAPILCQLGIGVLRVESGGEQHAFFIDRGFAQMVDNKLTILTEQARRPNELERAQILAELEAAQSMPIEGAEEIWADQRGIAIRRAKTQLAMAPKPD